MLGTDEELPAGAGSPKRPGSSWTNDSLFADSAISLRTPTPTPYEKDLNPIDEPEQTRSIAERLQGLVSEIWANEQDGTIRCDKRRRLETAIRDIETVLAEDNHSVVIKSNIATPHQDASSKEPEHIDDGELEMVRRGLSQTVESLRMRQQEQRHIHQLTIERLEAVAQRCIQQERRLREFNDEMVELQRRNDMLSVDNKELHHQLDQTQLEAANREVAVNAMSSAVSGLEGWLNETHSGHRMARKVVARGRGRFRGRYYVDEPGDVASPHALDASSDSKIIHEGVNAWLRGWRDIEEELRSSTRTGSLPGNDRSVDGNDWGEFQSASEAP
jgi:hypothetical protein